MTKLVVDADLPRKLTAVKQPVDLCDSVGHVLGRFFPSLNPSEFQLDPQISEDELERRKASNEKTYSTAEVLGHLLRLAS